MKLNKGVQDEGHNINSVNKTRNGHLRIESRWDAKNIDSLTHAISQATSSGASCTKLTDTTKLEIRDVDEEASDEEVLQAISATARVSVVPPSLTKRNTGRGTQTIVVTVPTSIVARLTAATLRIGYVNCSVRNITDVKKCYKCQGFGHT